MQCEGSNAAGARGRHWVAMSTLRAVAGIALLALVACVSIPSVRAVYDRRVDLSSYRTFGYFKVLGTDTHGYESLVTRALKSATRAQMEARGYRYADADPDLLLNFNGHLADRISVDRRPLPPSEYYDYRSYEAWRAYDVQLRHFKEGTLNIDVVDAARSRLVWEGVATGAVSSAVYKDREAAIERAVAEVFKRYPVPPALP